MDTGRLIKALAWLCRNNQEWRNRDVNIAKIISELRNPMVVDDSEEVEGDESAQNTEKTETFQVFFPDGSNVTSRGGQDSMDEFRELVKDKTKNGYDMEFRADLDKESCSDFKDNNLVNACVLQFPYGRGGMHEVRLLSDGSRTTKTKLNLYLSHLSLLSGKVYHKSLFVLTLYNISMKQGMFGPQPSVSEIRLIQTTSQIT